MNVEEPHNIKRIEPSTPEEKERWIRLTAEEERELRHKTPDERRAWLRGKYPTKELLARHLGAIGLPVLAGRARAGDYSDFENRHTMPKIVLLRDLQKALTKTSRRHGSRSRTALAISDLERHVRAGEYDDTPAESEAWAAKQTGEVKEIIDKMGGRRGE